MSIVELADGRIVLERLFGHFEFGIDDHLQGGRGKKKKEINFIGAGITGSIPAGIAWKSVPG